MQKKRTIHRRPRGTGGVEWIRQPDGAFKYRARKRKAGRPAALGIVRDTYAEASKDLESLHWDDAGDPRVEYPASCPLFQDFMATQIQGERMATLVYASWKRDEIVWRTRVWGSALGRMPLTDIDVPAVQGFLADQRRMAPVRDQSGRIALFVPFPDGRPDLSRPLLRHPDGRARVPGESSTERIRRNRAPDSRAVSHYVPSAQAVSPNYLKTIGASLSAFFEIARKLGYIDRNPMRDVEYARPRKGRRPRKSLTAPEAAALEGNLLEFTTALAEQGERFAAMVLTARDTGMRRGEICGLLRENVRRTREGPFIRIDNAIVRVPGGVEDSSTKSGRSREIPIVEETYARILALPDRRCPITGNHYAFSTSSGRPVRPDNFSRSFRAFRGAIGLPALRLHNLRHTFISLMLRAGVDIPTIQALVGHASPKMILEVYGETFRDDHRLSIGRFQEQLRDARRQAREKESGA